MGQEHGPVAEVLSDGWIGIDGGEIQRRLLVELEGRVELAVEEGELGLVPLRIALHLRLQRRQSKLLAGASGGAGRREHDCACLFLSLGLGD
ncbi:ARM repeat superfamily protein [Actinidia rufa]|uniref:ARM repeat superfamily protein n=1 Tax=Actinidia rufa TaxID=165716 RepID=A0A7J0FN66_9ERIC|nr:ARM repeat superfamily protein [Actinidia rufa]